MKCIFVLALACITSFQAFSQERVFSKTTQTKIIINEKTSIIAEPKWNGSECVFLIEGKGFNSSDKIRVEIIAGIEGATIQVVPMREDGGFSIIHFDNKIDDMRYPKYTTINFYSNDKLIGELKLSNVFFENLDEPENLKMCISTFDFIQTLQCGKNAKGCKNAMMEVVALSDVELEQSDFSEALNTGYKMFKVNASGFLEFSEDTELHNINLCGTDTLITPLTISKNEGIPLLDSPGKGLIPLAKWPIAFGNYQIGEPFVIVITSKKKEAFCATLFVPSPVEKNIEGVGRLCGHFLSHEKKIWILQVSGLALEKEFDLDFSGDGIRSTTARFKSDSLGSAIVRYIAEENTKTISGEIHPRKVKVNLRDTDLSIELSCWETCFKDIQKSV